MSKRNYVPSDQKLILRGLKSYVSSENVEEFMSDLGIKKITSTRVDKTSSPLKMCYLNFESAGAAKFALGRILEATRKQNLPKIFVAGKAGCRYKAEQKTSFSDSSSDDDGKNAEEEFIERLTHVIAASSNDIIYLSQVGNIAKEKDEWKDLLQDAGGAKAFCLDHDDIFVFVSDLGGGQVKIRKACTLEIGAQVQIQSKNPSYGWGHVFPWSIGTLREKTRNAKEVVVDFPEQKAWKGAADEIAESSGINVVKQNIVVEDPLFDQYGFVSNKSGNDHEGSPNAKRTFEFTGSREVLCGSEWKKFGFVHGAKKLTPEQPYFEVCITKPCENSCMAIGLSGTSFFAGQLAGCKSACQSIGLHSENGKLFLGGVEGTPFSSALRVGDVIGCGVIFNAVTKLPETVYFMRNGQNLGRVPLHSDETEMIYPIVTGLAPVSFDIDLLATPPRLDDACSMEERLDNKLEEIQEAVELQAKPFSNLELAIKNAVDGATVFVNDVGVHIMRTTSKITVDCTITASRCASKPVIRLHSGFVFSVHANNAKIEGLCIESVGGDALLGVSEGGTCCVALIQGMLLIESCSMSCEEGTAVWSSDDETKTHHLNMISCDVGPCGRHGIIISQTSACLQSVNVHDTALVAVFFNPNTTSLMAQCVLKRGRTGVRLSHVKATFLHKCSISGYTTTGISVLANESVSKAILRECKIVDCCVGLKSDGRKATLCSDSTNTIQNCNTRLQVDNKGYIITGAQALEQIKQLAGGVSQHNYFRLFCLLLDLAPKVLAAVLKACFSKAEFKEWSQSSCASITDKMDDKAKKRLGIAALARVIDTECEDWGITLLSSFLILYPGYLAQVGAAKKAVQAILQERDSIIYNSAGADLLDMSDETFRAKRDIVLESLQALIVCLPEEKRDEHRSLITSFTDFSSSTYQQLWSKEEGVGPSAPAVGTQESAGAPRSQTPESAKQDPTLESGEMTVRSCELLMTPSQDMDSTSHVASPNKGSSQTTPQEAFSSSEDNNFARFCKLLLDSAPKILSSLFMAKFREAEHKDWSKSCTDLILDKIDDYGKRRLGKAALTRLKDANCEEWDITLLSSLLLINPGYLTRVDSAKTAIDYIRDERNALAHSNLLVTQTMAQDVFTAKWGQLSQSLEVLIGYLPRAEADVYRSSITSIASEICKKSVFDSIMDNFRVEIREIAESARDKAEEALRASERTFERAATKSQVERIVAAQLESLLTARGQLDLSKLPEGLRDVELSNKKKYRLICEIGKGGMGTVFRAIPHEDRDQQVAFKVCETASFERAEREVTILKKLAMELKHANIVRFLDSAIHDKHIVIIMELIKGESLEDWLSKRYQDNAKYVTWQESKSIMTQLADGMAAVHALNIAHRDLKPSNLMLDEATGKLVIVDFGLSKQHNTNSTMTMGHGPLGTMLYMSPEQLEGNVREISLCSDVWAMGVVWHEILAFYTPFEPSNSQEGPNKGSSSRSKCLTKRQESELIQKILAEGQRKFVLLENAKVPDPIVKIIRKCLEANKAKRYQHAGELRDHVKDVFDELQPKAKSEDMTRTDSGGTKPFDEWTVDEVCSLLRNVCRFTDAAERAMQDGVDGATLLSLTKEELSEELNINKLKAKRLMKEINMPNHWVFS